ncbi:hypothetical protein SAMN04487785_12330 [Dyella jiangningensis]|uniref:hypothetical protein n=1 Tax=Dyella sp. AtDHG13 TaxID=1938897 RepID=UPI0008917606|nr:hypothetical protein [Dyella sp. AtDHG13]PXV56203.1 hypothetical protein BDW41_109195 [Dyella sp. AtDHG13]SDL49848.1 hypothetical protein SAMN04487785_12330 [Dyella jiangningensis]
MGTTEAKSDRTMYRRCLLALAMAAATSAAAAQQAPAPAQTAPAPDALRASTAISVKRDLFEEAAHLKNDLARYSYLREVMPQLTKDDRLIDQQLLATVEDELGLYDEAMLDFPFDNRVQTPVPLPAAADWAAADAATEIAKLATDRRIVMINEAHHDAHTRELTLALLPRLRAEGFTYFAAEALVNSDTDLMKRGYPIASSGSEYLHEPLYGQIIREAIRLGFKVVAYESEADLLADREAGQAQLLYREVFKNDPKARLFVHAGYAHIDKAVGNLGKTIKPMAMQLKQLTGFDPLSIDQTRWRDIGPMPKKDLYNQLIAAFPVDKPSVLLSRQNGSVWASDPDRHDVDVILPPSGHQRRPHWLTLGGTRQTRVISSDICQRQLPCVVEARFAKEGDDAIPADRYVFTANDTMNSLYLWPGEYKISSRDRNDRKLTEHNLTVGGPGS